jgi:hypothetical protein
MTKRELIEAATWVAVCWAVLAGIIWACGALAVVANADTSQDPGCFARMTCDPNTVIYCPDGRLITIYGACPQLITGPEGPTLPGSGQ